MTSFTLRRHALRFRRPSSHEPSFAARSASARESPRANSPGITFLHLPEALKLVRRLQTCTPQRFRIQVATTRRPATARSAHKVCRQPSGVRVRRPERTAVSRHHPLTVNVWASLRHARIRPLMAARTASNRKIPRSRNIDQPRTWLSYPDSSGAPRDYHRKASAPRLGAAHALHGRVSRTHRFQCRGSAFIYNVPRTQTGRASDAQFAAVTQRSLPGRVLTISQNPACLSRGRRRQARVESHRIDSRAYALAGRNAGDSGRVEPTIFARQGKQNGA